MKVTFKRGMKNGNPFYQVSVNDPDYKRTDIFWQCYDANEPSEVLHSKMKTYGFYFWIFSPIEIVAQTIRNIINVDIKSEEISFEVYKQ